MSFKKKLDLKELQKIFQEVREHLNVAKYQMLSDYKEVPRDQSQGYYEQVISFYDDDLLRDKPENILKIAKCNYELGLI